MTRSDLPLLSKSRFMAGLQCLKRLYLECYQPNLATPPLPEQEAVFAFGAAMGLVAQKLYPAGILVTEDYMHHADAVQHTTELLLRDDVDVLFEAAFTAEDIRVRVDILTRDKAALWNLIEVKASTFVRDAYINDAAIQLFTVERAGLAIGTISVAHLDSVDFKQADMRDPQQSFILQDVTAVVRRRAEGIPARLTAMHTVLQDERAPSIATGIHCTRPYRCQFFDYCHAPSEDL